jgi:hypothetical protein
MAILMKYEHLSEQITGPQIDVKFSQKRMHGHDVKLRDLQCGVERPKSWLF